jgi:hypothetical protein
MKQELMHGAQRAQQGLGSFEDFLCTFEAFNTSYLNEVNIMLSALSLASLKYNVTHTQYSYSVHYI